MRSAVVAAAVCLSILGTAGAQNATVPAARRPTHIPPEALGKALQALASERGFQLICRADLVKGLKTSGISGWLTPTEALAKLLRGSGLTYRYVDLNTVTIVPLPDGPDGGTSAQPSSGPSPSVNESEGKGGKTLSHAERKRPVEQLQEITVTGTHIRGAEESILPTQAFTREDVDQSGLGTVSAFLQTLSANFGGGMSEGTDAGVAGGGQSDENATAGTGVNLRGLGDDATLVLLDGHRIAPADLLGNFVDVSMIPLAAVQKIVVVTDGASAIYGSDAVGGVVNIITRQRFNGVETRARFGSDDHNDIRESEIGQTLGRAWGSGSALVSYEFYDRTPLNAADRAFTQSVPLPFTVLPEQVRQSVFATLNDSIGSRLSLYSDAYFSHRSTNSYDTILGSFKDYDRSTINSYGAIVGARLSITDTTELDISGDYSSGNTNVENFNLPQTVTPTGNQKAESTLATGDAVLSGALWPLPAGRVLYALGTQYRRETFDAHDFIALTQFAPSRAVSAGFGELRVPLLSSTRESGRRVTLELSLADREERYSDFGSTNNYSLGALWRPMISLQLRATYGTSFVAPLLDDTNPTPEEVAGFNTTQVPGSTPAGSGPVSELIEFGGNPDLRAQTAKTWTVGADWQSPEAAGLRAQLNYYDMQFNSRITDLQASGYSVWTALTMANIFGPEIVKANPSAALVQSLVSSPSLENFGADLNDIGAVIDSRFLNLSEVNTNGLDFSSAWRADIGRWALEPGIDATYVLHLKDRFTSASPIEDIVNTLYNPTRVKARGHLLVSKNPFSWVAYVNFVNSYTNNTTVPYSGIGSWTTFDLSATYSCDRCGIFLPGFSATLGVLNVLNRAPPYARNANDFAVDYDGANSSPLGRFISLDVTTRW